ncbi:B3/4 domain-containing protein [Runella sp. SP2]|uniref:B3/B4 domain-containing protein n=1 Tax=Runella sp. SP2 TaxID=2268026 RepID=UPI0013DD9579|nr:phenylalanine--tRNA ligase beta subunit-related protein [Runella sp. SP2]
MRQLSYKIEPSILLQHPDFSRGVVTCRNVDNTGLSTINFSELNTKLTANIENLAESKPVKSWRAVFRQMGIDPTKDRVSFEALTRRILNNGTLKTINPIVDLGNYFSILFQMPIGVHPIKNEVTNVILKKATGQELYMGFGSDYYEKVQPNEIILVDNDTVLTRRFCWRQSKQSVIEISDQSMFVNFDFIEKPEDEQVQLCMNEFMNAIKVFSPNAIFDSFVLKSDNQKHELCF